MLNLVKWKDSVDTTVTMVIMIIIMTINDIDN